ncbi:hypothetical protein BQ8794_220034 [Mesorhizobium prunaredense]|uniref:Uncharacterized protein n=1 Tax=Mesorhizobium prunaredense TaxID=1631249 RepID=A0A1R3V6L2_9HYPH|nr:hypothetical protein BQ8794_220034 [Mesorhizobium prunaredense]
MSPNARFLPCYAEIKFNCLTWGSAAVRANQPLLAQSKATDTPLGKSRGCNLRGQL